jgi:hypothetical protein
MGSLAGRMGRVSNPEYQREYRARHREELRAYNRQWMHDFRLRQREQADYAWSDSPLNKAAMEHATRQIELLAARIDRLPRLLTEEQKQRVQNLSTELWRRAAP